MVMTINKISVNQNSKKLRDIIYYTIVFDDVILVFYRIYISI